MMDETADRAGRQASKTASSRGAALRSTRPPGSIGWKPNRSTTAGPRSHSAREEEGRPQDGGQPGQKPLGDRQEPISGHPVRAVDQSLSRLRAWLHLLLRPAEPRFSRPVARPRFRDQALGEIRRGRAPGQGAGPASLSLHADRARRQYRPLPADRAKAADHAKDHRGAGASRSSADHRHQIGGGHPRSRSARTHGNAKGLGMRLRYRSPPSIRCWREEWSHVRPLPIVGWRRCAHWPPPRYRPW